MTATDRAAALELAKRWDALGNCETPHCDCTHNSAVTISRALLAAEAERERLATLVNEVEHDVNSVEQYRAARVRGGQHVGVGGALGNATPSALIYLRRLVRDMRAVIGKAEPAPGWTVK